MMETEWPCENRFTGIFKGSNFIPNLPHDPDIFVWGGTLAARGDRPELAIGGAGWTLENAHGACVGEGIERFCAQPIPTDGSVEASPGAWPLKQPPISPDTFVLFSDAQYAQAGFPFRPVTDQTLCQWVCVRRVPTGEAVWVPADLVYLFPAPGTVHQMSPGTSTGLSCGRTGDPIVLRGLQEVIERDAIVGGWWGAYPIEAWDPDLIWEALPGDVVHRVARRGIHYDFYRIDSPFSANVTLVLSRGEEAEGPCISAGAACGDTLNKSFQKALLEAIQGRFYVRHLRREGQARSFVDHMPSSFAEHGLYYSQQPEQLAETALARARPLSTPLPREEETLEKLLANLGPERPAFFRLMTPPTVAQTMPDWHVVKVIVGGLHPLHGDHRMPHLGGPLWRDRPLSDWAQVPPHPLA